MIRSSASGHYTRIGSINRRNLIPGNLRPAVKLLFHPSNLLVPPHGTAYKKRIYSPNRILYPLKRVDWDPKGERNPQNRGKSKYVRISWDEALDIVVSEIKRIQKKYGPEGICLQAEGHGESKVVNAAHGCSTYLMKLLGGYTQQIRNPDSWEGWYWGAKHVWGNEPVGLNMEFSSNLYNDVAKNTEMLILPGLRSGDYSLGFWRRTSAEPDELLVYRTGHQADLYLPRPELCGRRPCR